MKKQIKRFSKSTLAVVLTLCMLLSCVTVGIVSTNAAQIDGDSTGATCYLHYSTTDAGMSSATTKTLPFSMSVAKGALYVRVDTNPNNSTGDRLETSTSLTDNIYDDGTSENSGYKYRRLYFGKAMSNVTFSYDESTKVLSVSGAPTYTITTSADAGGTLSSDKSRATAGETVTLTITPERGKMLDQLTVSGGVTVSGSGNTRTFTMPAQNVTASATFKNASSYTVTANQVTVGQGKIRIAISGAGSATATTGSDATLAAYSGETLTVTAIADGGYTLDKLYVNGSEVSSPYIINSISGDVTVSAEFAAGSTLANDFYATPGSSITGNSDLYSGINATFFDYYTDNETTGGWYTGINGQTDAWIGGISERQPYKKLNQALSEYAQQNSVQYPVYFGAFNVSGYQDPGYYNSSANSPNWGNKINDSNSLGGDHKSLPGLAGLDINDDMIHYSASNTTANGANMVLFDKNWLTSRGTSDPDADKLKLVYNDTYNWADANAKVYVGFRGSWPNEYWVEMTLDSTNKRYTAEIPSGWESNNVVFARINPSYSLQTGNLSDAQANWDILDNSSKCWNKTGTGMSRDGMTYTLTSWTGGTWSGSAYTGPLASFVNTPFPVRKTTKNNATYYEFDSTGATDNIYFDNLTGGSPVVQYGAGTTYGQKNGYNNGYGFFPFDKYTDQKRSGLDWTKEYGKDLGFGMKLEIKFTLGKNGIIKADDGVTDVVQTFDFSGDDDLWVYIDDNLILDLGGDHKQSTGTINFNTRTIESISTDNTLTSSRNGSFASLVDNTDTKKLHTMTIYYLERGMHESNLKFGFSFNPLTDEIELEKEVNVDNVNEGLQDQVAAADSFDFTFADSTDSTKGKNTSYTVHNATTKAQEGSGNTDSNGKLTGLKNNQYAEIKKGFNVKDILTITESDPNVTGGYQYKTSYQVIDEEVDTSAMSNEITHGTGTSTGSFSYETIVPDANPYVNLTHMRAIFTNEVQTQNLTITKEISNKYDPDAQFPITVGISVNGTALNTNSLAFYRDGSATAENFVGGKAYIKQGEEIEIRGIPKGARVTVNETTPMPTNYSFVSKDNDAHLVNGNLSSQGYLTLNTDDYVTIVNKIAEKDLIITKALDNDIVDYASAFKITIERSDDNGATYTQVTSTLDYTHYEWNSTTSSYETVTGTLSATGDDDEYQIHNGCQLVIPNLPVGTLIRVKETDYVSDYYTYDDMTISGGATLTKDNSNRTGTVTMGSSAATLTIKNKAIRETIVITKTTDYDQDNSLFGVKVEMKQFNSNLNYSPVNVSGEYGGYKVLGTDTTWSDHNSSDGDGVYKIKKTGQIQIKEVPRGTRVQITEPSIGNSAVTGNQRFTANYVHVTNSSGATAGTNYLGQPWQCKAATVGGQVDVEVNNIVMKNKVIITKDILDANDTITEHTITVNITKDSRDTGGSAYSTITYTSSKSGEKTVANGASINIVEGETLTFEDYPVGTYFTVEEITPGDGYEFNSFTAATVTDKTVTGSKIIFKTTDTSGGNNVVINNKLGKRDVTVTKLVSNYTINPTYDKFKIKVQIGDTASGATTALANTAFTSSDTSRTDLTTASDGTTYIKQGEKLTFSINVGKYIKITEDLSDSTGFDFVSATAVDHGTTTAPTGYATVDNGCVFQLGDAGADVTVTNKLQTYKYVIKYNYEAYSAATYTSKTDKDDAHRVVGPTRSFTQRGDISQADRDKYFNINAATKEITFKSNDLRKEFINNHAPYEDDFMLTITWDKDPSSSSYSSGTISLVTTGTSNPDRAVKAYFKLPYDVDSNLAATGTTKKTAVVQDPVTTQYGNHVTVNDDFVTAPRTLEGGYYFQYWQITFVTGSDANNDKVANNTKRCYYDKFNMTLYQDAYIEPIYKTEAEGGSTEFNPSAASYQDTKDGEATVSFIETSRSSWNEGGAPDQPTDTKKQGGDRIYSDFLLTFGYKDKQLNTYSGNVEGANVKLGFVVEKVAELDKNATTGKYETKSQKYYKDTYDSGVNADTVKAFINGTSTENFLLNANINLTSLDNKNQCKYSLDMKNKEFGEREEPTNPYRNYVYRAYTYTKVGNNIVVSTPVYFTIYDMASIETV